MCADNSPGCAKARLTNFIRELLTRLMNENGSAQSQLMMREMIEPTMALDSIVKEVIAPLHEFVGQMVRDIVGEGVLSDEVRRCVFSIFGQCAFYRQSNELIRCLYPDLLYDPHEIEAIAKHIAKV